MSIVPDLQTYAAIAAMIQSRSGIPIDTQPLPTRLRDFIKEIGLLSVHTQIWDFRNTVSPETYQKLASFQILHGDSDRARFILAVQLGEISVLKDLNTRLGEAQRLKLFNEVAETAAKTNNVQLLKNLFDGLLEGQSLDSYDTLLAYAIKHGNIEILHFLYEELPEGQRINPSSSDADTAAENGQIHVLEYLYEGLPVDRRVQPEASAIIAAHEWGTRYCVEYIQSLIR